MFASRLASSSNSRSHPSAENFRDPPDELRRGTGLYERLSSGVLSLWVLCFAVQLWRLKSSGTRRAG